MNLTIPIAPSANKMWRHGRNGIVYKTKKCKDYQDYVHLLAKEEAKKQGWTMTVGEKVIIEYMFYWPDRRNRDTGNQKKVINDALEHALYDNDRYVLERDVDWKVDKGNPRVELSIRKYATNSD